MAEYEHAATVQAPADQVFEFVSNVRNMPKYLPTVQSATPDGAERVAVEGEANGHHYDSDGHFKVDAAQRTMEWGADEDDYTGRLKVDGQGSQSTITIHLSFKEQGGGDDQHIPDQTRRVQDGLEAAVESIRNLIEGQGGKVEPASAHEQGR